MIVERIRISESQDCCELRATIIFGRFKSQKFNLWYRFPLGLWDSIELDGSPFLAAMLLPGMALGEDLFIDAEMPKRLVDNLETLMNIYCCWDSRLNKIQVACRGYKTCSSNPSQVGSFFTLGIDSFYTLLKNIELHSADDGAISHLIFVHGFDISLSELDLFNKTITNIQKVAKEFNKQVIPVATNLRSFDSKLVDWGLLYHGAALASVGLALKGLFKEIYIASTSTYSALSPCGSHPLLDPLWSTEKLVFIHDGCEARRIDKIFKIAKSPVALETLRVCFKNTDGFYNCGDCPKCLRTMVGLHIAGGLENCKTLPHLIPLKAIRKMTITGENTRIYTKESLDELRNTGTNSQIRSAIEKCLSKYEREKRNKFRHTLWFQIKLYLSKIRIMKRLMPHKHNEMKNCHLWD